MEQKRERQYEHIKDGLEQRSSGRRGGLRSHRGDGGRTYRQLYNEAKERGIEGRSKMSKRQLERAVGTVSPEALATMERARR